MGVELFFAMRGILQGERRGEPEYGIQNQREAASRSSVRGVIKARNAATGKNKLLAKSGFVAGNVEI